MNTSPAGVAVLKRFQLILLLAAGPVPLMADESAVERCRLAGSTEARIACLEAALGAQTAPPATAPAVDPLPPAAPDAAPQIVVPLDDAPAVVGSDEVLDADDVTAPVESVEKDEPLEPVEAEAPVAAVPDADALGAEQLPGRSDDAPQGIRGVEVLRYETVPFRRLEVHLANGQVWRQIKGDTQEIRASLRKNRTVDIEKSSLGGYRLRLNEMNRIIRVRRVR